MIHVSPEHPTETHDAPGRHPGDGWVLADPLPVGRRTRRAFHDLVHVICPEGWPVALLDRVELHCLRMLPYMPPWVARGFCVGVHLLDWAPVWRGVALRRLVSLPRARAEGVLDGIGASRLPWLRLLTLGVRGMILSTFFDQEEVHRALGYAPEPFVADRIALRRRLLAAAAGAEGAA